MICSRERSTRRFGPGISVLLPAVDARRFRRRRPATRRHQQIVASCVTVHVGGYKSLPGPAPKNGGYPTVASNTTDSTGGGKGEGGRDCQRGPGVQHTVGYIHRLSNRLINPVAARRRLARSTTRDWRPESTTTRTADGWAVSLAASNRRGDFCGTNDDRSA